MYRSLKSPAMVPRACTSNQTFLFQYESTLAQEAIGNTVLDVMENEDLQENAWNVGNKLIENIRG